MVRIKDNLKDPTVDLWYYKDEDVDKGEYIGTITNVIQFHDVRLQIAKEHAWGYKIYYNKQLISIDSTGNLECWPEGLYDQVTDLLLLLL